MRPDWVVARHAMLDLLPPSSFFSISFQHFVKILTSRSISFSISPIPTYAGWLTLFYPPPRNTYVSITFFFCLQKSSASDTMERRIKYLCVGKRFYIGGAMKTISKNKNHKIFINDKKSTAQPPTPLSIRVHSITTIRAIIRRYRSIACVSTLSLYPVWAVFTYTIIFIATVIYPKRTKRIKTFHFFSLLFSFIVP